MTPYRIALANLRYPQSGAEAVAAAEQAIGEAADGGAQIVCFPEAFVPGYRWPGRAAPRPDAAFLSHAIRTVAAAAARSRIGVVLGTERVDAERLLLSAVVFLPDGSIAGRQDKVQLDPSEEATYSAGTGRSLFSIGPLTFGVVICHEGFRYPETVRWAARRGAQVVFHPHYDEAEPGAYRPTTFADPANTFHEKALLCRAAENTCYLASVNCAGAGSPTTSAVVRPDGTLQCHQPYGVEGLLFADLDLDAATCLLARRCKDAG